MTKFSNKFKKPCFWHIFGAKRFFKKNPALSGTLRHGPLTPCRVSEKTNEPIPRKLPDRRKDRRTDGRTEGRTDRPYFIGPFQLPPGIQKEQKLIKTFLMLKVIISLNN